MPLNELTDGTEIDQVLLAQHGDGVSEQGVEELQMIVAARRS